MRVIAGRLRGRALKAPPGEQTRPTGAKVKEALFSILGDVSDLLVLDLYAGSGALGIEALSRGARGAVFVEAARPAVACLRENLGKLGIGSEATLLPLRAEAAQAALATAGPFELVLCDPPWRDAHGALLLLEMLARRGVFSPDARIVLEHAAKDQLVAPAPLKVVDERRWGDTAVSFYGLDQPADAPVPSLP